MKWLIEVPEARQNQTPWTSPCTQSIHAAPTDCFNASAYELPHGVFPIAPIVAASLVQILFPDAPVYSLAADSVFSVVNFSNLLLSTQTPVDKDSPFWRH
eukprot:scaffold143411_cov17-Tisochrysis_lutea.AAC.1